MLNGSRFDCPKEHQNGGGCIPLSFRGMQDLFLPLQYTGDVITTIAIHQILSVIKYFFKMVKTE